MRATAAMDPTTMAAMMAPEGPELPLAVEVSPLPLLLLPPDDAGSVAVPSALQHVVSRYDLADDD